MYTRRVLSSIRNRGLAATVALTVISLQSFLESLVPRTIWGERIGLRSVKGPLTDAEVEQVYKWSHDEEMLKWSGGTPSELTLDQFQDQSRRERWHPESNQRVFYIVTRSGELIGRIGLYSIDWAKKDGELGISIDKEYWNRQYGREAIKLLTRYVFAKMPIQRICLGTFKDNVRAQRAFAACGFRVVGTARRFAPIEGEYRDGIVMELTQQDFCQWLLQEA
jgi:RimJ/RimL family protein N-acetyltransferase